MPQLRNFPRGGLYKDQYNRMLRWYGRFQTINEGRQTTADFEGQYDEMLAFFMNCDHLYDWIICDLEVSRTHPKIREYRQFLRDLKDFRSGTDFMKLCADLSIGAKHLNANRRLHFREETRVRTEVHIDDTGADPVVRRVWIITSESGDEYDAFELATQCVEGWREFLHAHITQIQGLLE